MNNIMSMYRNFMQNPMAFMLQSKINIPQDMAGNPNAIIDYLMSNGKVNQQQYNQAQQMFRQFRKR